MGGYCWFREHEINLNQEVVVCESDFRPWAYSLVYNNDQLTDFKCFEERNRCLLVNDDNNLFNFQKHSYLIVYGAPVKRAFFSLRHTWTKDPSPAYAKARRKGKDLLFLQYGEPDGYCRIYVLDKVPNLSCIDGL